MHAAHALPLIAMVLSLNPLLAQQGTEDDTYTDMEKPGPVAKIDGFQGYDGYTLMTWEDGTKIDARGARWQSYMFGRQIRDPETDAIAKNNYPIQLGADWKGAYPNRVDFYNYGLCPAPQKTRLYWAGGIIEGTTPLDITWMQSKASNGGGITLNALDSTVDGVRLHNIHDGILPLEGNNFTIKNCWVSYIHDDAIENDGFAAGLVDDCLFDRVFVFYSARNTRPDSGRQAEAPGGGKNSTVRIQNCLIRLDNFPSGPDEPPFRDKRITSSFGNFWKQSDPRNPRIEIVNNIICISKPNPHVNPRFYNPTPQNLKKSENNVVVWLGEGKYPHKPEGFTVIEGPGAGEYWEKARQAWIDRHPKVPRIKGDPGYDPAIVR